MAVTGSLLAQDQTTLSVKVPGRVQVLTVDLGSPVRAGDMVAQIEPRDYQLQVQQAEAALAQARVRLGLPLTGTEDRVEAEQISTVKQAQALLDEARANHERVDKLHVEGISSEAQVETATSGYGVALNRYQDALEEARQRQAIVVQRRAELEIARQLLADTAVLAPYDGVIQERRAHLGDYLAIGSPVATLVRIDPLRLRMEIPEREIPKVRLGQKTRFTVEGDREVYEGTIQRMSPGVVEQSRMLVVEAEVRNNGTLHPGSFAHSEIVVSENTPVLSLETNAILVFAGLEKVLAIENGRTTERRVTTGDRQSDWVEILGGVREGEVVAWDPASVRVGETVTAAP